MYRLAATEKAALQLSLVEIPPLYPFTHAQHTSAYPLSSGLRIVGTSGANFEPRESTADADPGVNLPTSEIRYFSQLPEKRSPTSQIT